MKFLEDPTPGPLVQDCLSVTLFGEQFKGKGKEEV